MLARYCAEDPEVSNTTRGKRNSNCYDPTNDNLTVEDIAALLSFLAGTVTTLPIAAE